MSQTWCLCLCACTCKKQDEAKRPELCCFFHLQGHLLENLCAPFGQGDFNVVPPQRSFTKPTRAFSACALAPCLTLPLLLLTAETGQCARSHCFAHPAVRSLPGAQHFGLLLGIEQRLQCLRDDPKLCPAEPKPCRAVICRPSGLSPHLQEEFLKRGSPSQSLILSCNQLGQSNGRSPLCSSFPSLTPTVSSWQSCYQTTPPLRSLAATFNCH